MTKIKFVFATLILSAFLVKASAQTGLIHSKYIEYDNQNNGEQYRVVWSWNTKTGKSMRYYYDQGQWHKSSVALPANPLGTATNQVGEVMMDYCEYDNVKNGEQYRAVWVWDTKTGKSARYYYDQGQWHKSSVALPANPLGTATSQVGEVMMNYREYDDMKSGEQYRSVWVWDTKTGKTARYYYDQGQWHKSSTTVSTLMK